MAHFNLGEIRQQLETKVRNLRDLFPRRRSNTGETNILQKETKHNSDLETLNLFSPDRHSGFDLPQEDSESAGWTDTLQVDQRPSKKRYREKEIEDVMSILQSGEQKVVMLEGMSKVGKTSTILECAHLLRERGVPFSIFSPKEFQYDSQGLRMLYEKLLAYSEATTQPVAVLIDSCDYLAAKTKDPQIRQIRVQLLQLLQSPQFRIIGTYHPNWITPNDKNVSYGPDIQRRGLTEPEFNTRKYESPFDPALYMQWVEVFDPESTVYILKERIQPDVAKIFLKDHLIIQKQSLGETLTFSDKGNYLLEKIANSPSATLRQLKRFPVKYFEKFQHDLQVFPEEVVAQNIEAVLRSLQ